MLTQKKYLHIPYSYFFSIQFLGWDECTEKLSWEKSLKADSIFQIETNLTGLECFFLVHTAAWCIIPNGPTYQ